MPHDAELVEHVCPVVCPVGAVSPTVPMRTTQTQLDERRTNLGRNELRGVGWALISPPSFFEVHCSGSPTRTLKMSGLYLMASVMLPSWTPVLVAVVDSYSRCSKLFHWGGDDLPSAHVALAAVWHDC